MNEIGKCNDRNDGSSVAGKLGEVAFVCVAAAVMFLGFAATTIASGAILSVIIATMPAPLIIVAAIAAYAAFFKD